MKRPGQKSQCRRKENPTKSQLGCWILGVQTTIAINNKSSLDPPPHILSLFFVVDFRKEKEEDNLGNLKYRVDATVQERRRK